MENVSLTPKELARLQVLNSLLTEQNTSDQAAELMGASPRHTRRMLAAYPESTEAMVAGVETRDDGQGKASGAGLIPQMGMRAA